jgi:hypothetical protein
MTFRDRLEAAAGQELPVLWEDDLLGFHGGDRKAALTELERNSRVVNMVELLAGRERVSNLAALVVTGHRDGFLIRLMEVRS